MPWPATPSNLRTDMVAGMSRSGVEAEEMAKHAVAINTLEANASAVGHTHNVPWQFAPSFLAPVAGDASGSLYITVATNLTAFRVMRTGGTGATIDILRNGVSILTAVVSATSTTAFVAAALAATPTVLNPGDILKVSIVSITGGVTNIDVSAEGTRSTS